MTLPAIFLRASDEGEVLAYGDGNVSSVLASGDATGGAFSVVEHRLRPGAGGPPLHRHERLCDSFYVLEGTLTLRIGEHTVSAGAGSYACFPPGVAHCYRNDTDAPVRMLNINSPGGWDRVLRALVFAGGDRPLDRTEIGRVSAEYDMIVLE
ncbi:cupin domain-containing protein [Amycolatopsis sp. WAC 01376]|uniref:cupin domain-containing protein n=1 Tax=unclassified Amycolatopsis TaxID=2618356 RepID=UPI000F77AA42|nr:cupin domain-containing protein [Amycolatopsis sp. WAC 01376]RSM62494.1 cupin domain-containing protein [Amycolatopsis sp. WAC 01376]